jgi:hypothetical protein
MALLYASCAYSADAFVQEGEVYFRAAAASPPLRLTRDAAARKAVLTPDGRWVLYYSGTTGMIIDGGAGQAYHIKEYIVRTDGKQGQLLRSTNTLGPHGASLDSVFRPLSFALSGRAFYFAEDNEVKRFDLGSGSKTRFCEGFTVDVIRRGAWAGFLVVTQEGRSGGYDLWLVDDGGKRVRQLTGSSTFGEERDALRMRLREGGELPPPIKD